MNAIEIRDLSKSYKDFNLEHMNLTLPGGCIMGLVGENGAGKSTTIKLILNMIHRDGGSISILGRDNVTEMQSLKEDIGVVLDEVGLPECLNRRQVGNIMALTFKNWDSDYFEALCVKLGVPDQKKFGEYSKGMKMKIMQCLFRLILSVILRKSVTILHLCIRVSWCCARKKIG